jgi:hypothetical protein
MQLHTVTEDSTFFAAGFTSMDSALCHWAAVGKSTAKPMFATLFGPCKVKDKKCLEIKKGTEEAVSNVNVLTQSQWTAEWLMLWQVYLLTATSKVWFSQNCSTPAMIAGAKNESVVLQAFSKLSYVRSIFEVGLLENKTYPWMAASADGVAVMKAFWHPLK